MKIRPVGAELSIRTDGQTDMAKLKVAFLNFVKAAKNKTKNLCIILRYRFVFQRQFTARYD
jgi:hypothetical protein